MFLLETRLMSRNLSQIQILEKMLREEAQPFKKSLIQQKASNSP